MNINHDYNFDGGDKLRSIGASWFISYMYWWYIDRTHLNWKKVKTYQTRMFTCNESKKYHLFWTNQVMQMDYDRLSTNKIDLDWFDVKYMASKLLEKYKIFVTNS